jgi:hypothetical protein
VKIFLYWNYKDRDSKRIYQFLNNAAFKEGLESRCDVVWQRMYCDFQLDDKLLNDMLTSDLLLFFTHGDDDAILKFRYNDEAAKEQFTFINQDNATILKKKKVIAICCRSANILGKYCVGKNIESKFYIGFHRDLIYDEGFTDDFKSIVYRTYSNAFEMALLNACSKEWTADKFVLMLQKNIIDMLTKEILNSKDRKLGSISGITFHRKTAESLVVLGQSDQLIFE